MCQADGISMDHLLLHCTIAREKWDLEFCLFGIKRVTLRMMIRLLECWKGRLGKREGIEIVTVIPICLTQYIRRESTAYCDIPDCVDLNYEGIVWACVESRIKKVLGQFGLYKQLGGAPIITGSFGVYCGYGQRFPQIMKNTFERK